MSMNQNQSATRENVNGYGTMLDMLTDVGS